MNRSTSDSATWDVVIAGAGPVGLFLASELRLAGCTVLVLERAASADAPLKQLPFGLRGLWGSSMATFHRRGLLEAMLAAPDDVADGQPRPPSAIASDASQRRGPAGHFAGLQFDLADVDTTRWDYHLSGPSDTRAGISLAHLESVLAAHALANGVVVRRGCAVESFEASDDGVTVEAGGQRFHARFLVGCDGGRSMVRKLGGFEFAGTEPEFTGYSIQATFEDPTLLPQGRHFSAHGMVTQWQPGVIGLVDFDGGAAHRLEPLTLEHVQAVLRRVSGTQVTLTALHLAATWTDRSRQATTYRRGRVLLAGDAAHVHSPLGGQGLNLGLGDAMNLGWKLGATLRGEAPDGLLDSYTTERHPVGARILDWTRAQVALMRPGTEALQSIMRDLLHTRDGATYFAERLWGVSIQHGPGGAHPLVGRSCPDFELRDGVRVGKLLRDGHGLLLDFDPATPLRALEGRWGARVRYVASDATERFGLSAVLVRPDGVVAWASDAAPDIALLEAAAASWFVPAQD
ncbi:2-polyprenyl-6-methoxyphenol hydroxylase [Pseudoxanthomonas sp. GM95]|uniref:FAD-dependent monooxygenase n=1 Tax=Pseudoxanthomonas sp. GM95 TaxID=1881043 RepID=UPI0008D0DC2F|nr:FAD-dependent monooxygenase [Pseudoxanthomonas sp. GM95]SEM19803.1 2-polyprenyl-6-methoxyphenol hydroxylase [Pseudoxanthomonas sp. GM95]